MLKIIYTDYFLVWENGREEPMRTYVNYATTSGATSVTGSATTSGATSTVSTGAATSSTTVFISSGIMCFLC